MRVSRSMSFAFVAAVGSSLLFQNCQPVFRTESASSTASPSPAASGGANVVRAFKSRLEAVRAPFADRKVKVAKVGAQAIAKVQAKTGGSVVVPAGDRLVAILRNDCARTGQGPVAARFYDPSLELPNLDSQTYVWVVDQSVNLDELTAAAEEDPCVIGLTNDDVAHSTSLNDPKLSQQLDYLSIGGPEADVFFGDGAHGARATVVVAVIDSGINHNHEDLKNRLWSNPTTENASATGTHGYNFAAENYYVWDDYGHGTFVAGIIAAEANNGVGIAGVMGHDIQIQANKVLNSAGEASMANISRAIDYAVSKGVNVINLSMEGPDEQPALLASLNAAVAANVFVAVAAGNDKSEISSSDIVVPAYYGAQIAGMMTVGSIDSYTSTRSSFSNYSTQYVEIAAPGDNGVYSTTSSGGYGTNRGTSFSSPLVAGAAALTISFFKKNGISYTAAMVEDALANSAVSKAELTDAFQGGRVLDLRSLAMHLQRTYLSSVDGGFDEN